MKSADAHSDSIKRSKVFPNSALSAAVENFVAVKSDGRNGPLDMMISTATERLTQQCVESVAPIVLAQVPETGVFPTMAEVERAMIVAAFERSNRRPLEAARLLGIGKTTVYRKLRAMGEAAA